MKQAVVYLRVSSQTQIENTSLDNQLSKIQGYCKAYDYSIAKVYKDNGISGKAIDHRQQYNNMLEFIKSNNIDALIVFKSDRIHRKLKNLLIMIEDILEPANTSFVSITEQFDTSTSQGKLFLQMIGSFGEFEGSLINERTRDGRLKTATENKHAGGEVPYGYEKIKGVIKIDPGTAEIVQTIYSLYNSKKSLGTIKMELDLRGCTTKRGKSFSRPSIHYILRNKTYTGCYSYNGKKEKNMMESNSVYPQIIAKNLFGRVQNILSRKS